MDNIHLQGPVAVALSGGADSLYALLRLRESGVPVMALHGIFTRPELLPDNESKTASNTSASRTESMRHDLACICDKLGVPLHIVDLSTAFLEKVIRPFVQSYAQGNTPNPCALCNARIKFGLLLEKARELGTAKLATGHYARLISGKDPNCLPTLLQGADPHKDQSYFLALVPQQSLQSALFPLGDSFKSEVKEWLMQNDYEVPIPKESQEVCFVENDDYKKFFDVILFCSRGFVVNFYLILLK